MTALTGPAAGRTRLTAPTAEAACAAAGKDWRPCPPGRIDLDAHLADMLRIVSETFEVERAALFSPDAEGPVMVRNISRLELESPTFRPVLKKAAAVMEAASGEPARAARGTGIYLPLAVPNARPWLLFLQCEFFAGHISAQGTEIFRELGGLLARELQTARRLQEGMRKALYAVEERGRVAAERMAALDEPYYGTGLDDVLRQADSTAVTDAPVLILGETGVGKDQLPHRRPVRLLCHGHGREHAGLCSGPAGKRPEHAFL